MRAKKKLAADLEICGNCKYYDNCGDSTAIQGWCMRYPPVILASDTEDGGLRYEHPAVEETVTCGEFKRRLNS